MTVYYCDQSKGCWKQGTTEYTHVQRYTVCVCVCVSSVRYLLSPGNGHVLLLLQLSEGLQLCGCLLHLVGAKGITLASYIRHINLQPAMELSTNGSNTDDQVNFYHILLMHISAKS